MMKKGIVFSLFVLTAFTSCRDKVDVQTNIQDVVDAIGHRTQKINTYECAGNAKVDGVDQSILFDFSSQPPDRLRLNITQVFGDYMCEGYKPVLVPAANAKVSEAKGQWVVKAPLEDSELQEVEITFNTPNADFVSKRFINKSGIEVMQVKVLEESPVPNSKIRVPQKWQKTQGTKSYEVTLTDVFINQKIDPSRFSMEIPEGYTLKEFGK